MASKKASTKKAAAKWQVVENVVAAIEKVRTKVPGMRLIQKAQVCEKRHGDSTREVDVLIEIPTGDRTLRVGVEVKHEARPIDVVTMEGLSSKKDKLSIDRLCVVSASGFTARAEREAQENGIELATLEEFETSDWWLAAPQQEVHRNQVELIHVHIACGSEEGAAWNKLGGVDLEAVEVSPRSGAATNLKTWLTGFGITALNQNKARALEDQDEFAVRVVTEAQPLVFRYLGSALPTPDAMVGQFRLHRQVELVDEHRYRTTDGVEAFSARINDLLGSDRQATFVAVPQPDGSRQLVVALGEADPKCRRRS